MYISHGDFYNQKEQQWKRAFTFVERRGKQCILFLNKLHYHIVFHATYIEIYNFLDITNKVQRTPARRIPIA